MRACIAGHSLIAGRLDPRLLLTWFLQWAAPNSANRLRPLLIASGRRKFPTFARSYVVPARSCGSMVLNCVSACRAFLGGSAIA
ncbi:hypothetical protein ACVL91_009782 [Bradyrhizobium elkanii]